MEKKGLRKKDILRMDGLLPPTRRLPVCDAVSSSSDKKKDKKWSIGGILRRISSIRDYDSSSNDEEIVYCNRTPRKLTKFNRQSDGIVLHSIENNPDKRITAENNARHSTDSLHSHRDSLHSRSSDGSLDGLGKKTRKNKLKARVEAKRDHLRADSSSDEDCRKSNNSLNRFHGADGAQNGQRSNVCSRRTRAARTERYIKRLSRDDGNGSGDTLNDLHTKRCSSEYIEDKERAVCSIDANGLCRPPIHPRRLSGAYSNNRAFPVRKSSADSLQEFPNCTGSPEVLNDFRRYSTGQYVTDLNQNNTYGKISRDTKKDVHANNQAGHFFTYPAKNVCHYGEPYDYAADRRLINPYNRPPEPPPRDPRYRVFNYGYGSYPANSHQNVSDFLKPESNKADVTNGISKFDLKNFRSYGSNDEIAWRDMTERELENTTSNSKLRNSLERTNNKYNSSRQWTNKTAYEETEATKCRHRNTRNDELNSNDAGYNMCKVKNKSANICESNKYRKTISSAASPDSSFRSREQCVSVTPATCDNRNDKNKKEDNKTATEEALERRRSSKNLEEALSELEAIYNSLRLGDEDLLDRAERRSMEEFSLKHGKIELDATTVITQDSPDRTKDDMAYRRMHPKERPSSLSDSVGQSTLSNISYLIASPILSRRDSAENLARLSSTYPFTRRDEPDVTRDDVVFRSINHANNTLRVIEPQPPFGIPIGPVTTATESDYLHTTPTKPEQPRSPYIPQCEPDVVTDDLAYRSLRKDTGAARNVVTESKNDVSKEQSITCGMKKKRATRSLSANLYGLINHDRIHLRREPSFDIVSDEIQDVTRNFGATSERPEYLRRVVSDGELSDNERWKEPKMIRGNIDINGNHPTMDAYRKKLRVYVSPEATVMTRKSPKKESNAVAEFSDAMLSSKAILDDEFWHEYLRSNSNSSVTNSGRSAETDFTAYSRLCQDLVDLIKSNDDDKAPPRIESSNDSVGAVSPDKSDNVDVKLRIDEPSSVDIHSPDSRYSGSQCEEENIESENAESTFSTTNSTGTSESAPAPGNLDFYLRVADENVKLIAEAFGSVADRLRDSCLSARKKNNSLASHGSEMENQSGSARSSALCNQGEQTSDDRLVVASRLEETPCQTSKRNSWTSNEGDQSGTSRFDDVSTADAELDLSRAVRDLQLAAASLCEHGREIEELKIRRGRLPRVHNVTPITATTDTDENEGNSIRKIEFGLIVDALRQEQERDQEETVVLPNKRIESRSDAQSEEERHEGERTVCELDRTKSEVDAHFVRVPCVTNLITVTVTTYSILLLACLLALLLAIVVAS